MPHHCFHKCINICKSKIYSKKRKHNINECDIHDLKAKGRSVTRGFPKPRRMAISNMDIVVEKIRENIKNKSLKENKQEKRKFEYKNKFRCLFCRGKKCYYENYLNNPQRAIEGLNCDLIDDQIYIGQRPCSSLIKKFNLIKTFISKNIGLVINLQKQGEHPYCGPGEIDPISGFTYRPSMFTSEGIRVKLAGWKESNEIDAMDMLLDIIKEIVYTITIEKKAVYIHCHTGNSRSGIVVACFKMFCDKNKAEEAVEFIQYYRKELVKKKDQFKYVLKFQDYLANKREIFSLDKLDVNTFLKNQWDLELVNVRDNISYIPKIIYKCITKLLAMKFSKNRAYSNDVIYKAMNGSLEIIDDTYIQIKNLMIKLNDGYWEAIEHCDSTVILSEILFLWMDESVEACINPKRIVKIFSNNVYRNNIDSILSEKSVNIEIISNIYELCKKILRKSEFEILKFFSFFCNKLYPSSLQNPSEGTRDKQLLKKSNAVLCNSFCSLDNKIKNDFEEYNQMVEKISIYILGFNIDMLFTEGPNIFSFHRNINNNCNMSSSCDTTIYSTSVNNFLTQSHMIQRDEEREFYSLAQRTIKLIEFFRIYFSLVNNKDNIPVDDEVYQLCGGNNIIVNHIDNKTNFAYNKELKILQNKIPKDETEKQSNIEEDENPGSSLNKSYSYLSLSSREEEIENEEEEEEEEKEEEKEEEDFPQTKRKKPTLQLQFKQKANKLFNKAHLAGTFVGINLKNKNENNKETPSDISFFSKKRNTTGLGLNNKKRAPRLKDSLKNVHKNNELLYTVVPQYVGNNGILSNKDYETKKPFALPGKKKKIKLNVFAKSIMPIIITPISNNDNACKSKKDDFIINRLNHQTNILRFSPSINK